MATSQRVLSGSRTRGSTATPSGSIIYSYQGIYANSNASYFGSLLPRIGSGTRTKLYKDGKPLSQNEFDDSLIINKDTADMRTLSGSAITTRIDFDLERLAFGQPPTTQQGEPFADISGFNPVSFILDPGHTMWPANLWNAGSLPDHEFDGVIEVFDIRREILGDMDLRYEGHAPRGSVTGPFSENPFGSTEITETWKFSDNSLSPFLDGPHELSRDRGTDTPVSFRMWKDSKDTSNWTDPNSTMPYPGYQGLEKETLTPFVTEDYHEIVYSQIYHNNPAITPAHVYDLTKDFYSSGKKYDASPNLVAWWRLGKMVTAAGNILDSSVNSFTGSFPGSYQVPAVVNGPSVYVAEKAYDFDGTDDAFVVTGGSGKTLNEFVGGSYNDGSLKSFSIAFWVKEDGVGSTSDRLVQLGRASSSGSNHYPGIAVTISNTGTVTVHRVGWTGILSKVATEVLSVGAWAHVVITWDFGPEMYSEDALNGPIIAADAVKVYVNGVSRTVATSGTPTGQPMNVAYFADYAVIGGYDFPPFDTTVVGAGAYDGEVAEIAVFDAAISAANVSAMYLAASGSITSAQGAQQDPLITGLALLNSSSCNTLTDPLDFQANRGFYFGSKAGSIVYGDW